MDQTGYSAQVLLERDWRFDVDELAELLAGRFDALGPVTATRARSDDGVDLPALDIDGAVLPIDPLRRPIDALLNPPEGALMAVRDWDVGPAIAAHRAALRLSCRGPGTGLVWAKAYATVVTLVAGALAKLGPATAVHFEPSGTLLTPDDAYAAGRAALRGVSPIEAWVGLHVYAPANPGAPEAHGALTVGLVPFIGRELALAPAPIDPRQAVVRARGAAWGALDGETPLADRQTLREPHSDVSTRVRAAPAWLRPGIPVFVLLGDDAVVDAESLTLSRPGAGLAGFGGLPSLGAGHGEIGARALGVARAAGAGLRPAMVGAAQGAKVAIARAPGLVKSATRLTGQGIAAGRRYLRGRRTAREESR